jgi:hypothetical protein
LLILQIEREEAVAKEEKSGDGKNTSSVPDDKEKTEREKQEQRERLNRWKVTYLRGFYSVYV